MKAILIAAVLCAASPAFAEDLRSVIQEELRKHDAEVKEQEFEHKVELDAAGIAGTLAGDRLWQESMHELHMPGY